MSRRKLIVATALLCAAAVSGAAAAASTTTVADVPSNAAVRVVPGAAECGGAHFSKVIVPLSERGYMCIHSAPDAPIVPSVALRTAAKPATAPVKCYGDGTTGPRIQMIYGYYDGLPNRSKTVIAQFRSQMAPRMQAVINAQGDGRDLGLRFAWTKGCGAIDVKVVKFPSSVPDGVKSSDKPGDPGGQLGRAANTLIKLGYDRGDRNYQILYDGWAKGACGVAFTPFLAPATSAPGALLVDGLPTVGARTDAGSSLPYKTAGYAMTFNAAGSPKGPTCFTSRSLSTVTTQIHELFHNLGAVQADAPHSDGKGHCDDAPSVMCSGNAVGYGAGVSNPFCVKVLVETLDCGMDDYWNPSPTAGTYLATHLNIAKSQYFGPQPQDNLVASPL